MDKQFEIDNKKISYVDEGEGSVIVLLHGYLETKEVWGVFAEKLSKLNRVISIDIPGHGHSDIVAATHTMELLAERINTLLDFLKIDKCTMVGHSMGGYVMLAFADIFGEKLSKMVLFHSSIYADSEDKRKSRLNDVVEIEGGNLESIVRFSIPNTFAKDNVDIFSQNIEDIKSTALMLNPEGVCAVLKGMAQRTVKQSVVSSFGKPMLFIFGAKDNFIPLDIGIDMAQSNNNIELCVLKESGHMGFIEEEEESFMNVVNFINKE